MSTILVVAGEASGDRAGAAVLARLRKQHPDLVAFGMGGGALEREGLELLADLRTLTALGVGEVARRAYGVGAAYATLRAAIARRQPDCAILVNYTEFNSRLAPILWARGTRVLWYGAPQVWAWRPSRAEPLRKHIDRLALMLPFEEPIWRDLGVDAHYVGHPSLEEQRGPGFREEAREHLGLTPFAWGVAILPGSRPHEVQRLLVPMLDGYEIVRHDRASVDARVFLAPSLDRKARAWAESVCKERQVDIIDVDARAGLAHVLPAFDAAICASGTASLECALAGAIPVICYRVGWATELGARVLMKTPLVGLPNILLREEAFPELLQRRATAPQIAEELDRVLAERPKLLARALDVEHALHDERSASARVAAMVEPWLASRGRARAEARA